MKKKDHIQALLAVLLIIFLFNDNPYDYSEEERPEPQKVAAIIDIPADSYKMTAADSIATHNDDSTTILAILLMISLGLVGWVAYEWWWDGGEIEIEKLYKPTLECRTRHFVAAKTYMTKDDQGRDVEETMILTKDNKEEVLFGRSTTLTNIDVNFVLEAFKKYGKTKVEQLPQGAIEAAKIHWAKGLGANKIAKLNIGMCRSYCVATIAGFNASLRYQKAIGEMEERQNQKR